MMRTGAWAILIGVLFVLFGSSGGYHYSYSGSP